MAVDPAWTGRPIRSVSEFRKRFPKLANASEVEIYAAIENATNMVRLEAHLVRYADAIEMKAAALLEAEKYGMEAAGDGSNPGKGNKNQQYQDAWNAMKRMSPLKGMVLRCR